jgi:hypothetical protein
MTLNGVYRRRPQRKGGSMKFSWDEKRFTEIEEDWTISKVYTRRIGPSPTYVNIQHTRRPVLYHLLVVFEED